MRNPIRLIVKTLIIIGLAAVIIRGAYTQGVQHAIVNAQPSISGTTILIDFDGQVHEYR